MMTGQEPGFGARGRAGRRDFIARTAATSLLLLIASLPLRAAGWVPADPAGAGLDTRQYSARVAPSPAYAARPLTVECWAAVDGASAFNILIANEPKSSATHWELFTTPGDGLLAAYLPGCKPDHVRTTVRLTDARWHHVAMVLEERRARLFVDGLQVGEEALERPAGQAGVAGSLAIGALENAELGCDGRIAAVRLSRAAREIEPEAAPPAEADAETLGLWRFDAEPEVDRVADRAATGAAAVLVRNPNRNRETGIWPRTIHGGMSAAFQPMPPAEDVAEARALLGAAVRRLGLTAASVEGARDGVLRHWLAEYRAWRADPLAPGQLDYPQSRPHTWADKDKVAEQTYDRHALVRATDGGPLGTALRRTGALLDWLRTHHPKLELTAIARDHRLLAEGARSEPPPPRESDEELGLYLATCALRRDLALRNPLLDFDTVLCVARGTFEGSARSNPSTTDIQGGHFVTQYFGFNALPGGGLFLLRGFRGNPEMADLLAGAVVQDGPLAGRRLDHGAFATPDLSFDGREVVFAWTASREHKWVYSRQTVFHIFKVNIDGTGLTQLTDGDCNDFDPCWLPDGRIAFVSERRGGHIRCFGDVQVRTYTLFSMAADGTDITPLSYYETSEWNPTVDNDGRLVFTRWDYTDRENCLGSRIWLSWPDGTDPRAPHGNYPHPYHTFSDHQPWRVAGGREIDSRIGAPLVEMGIRAIPGSPRYVFTAAPHHGQVYGAICLLDLRVPDDGHMSQVRRVTPDEPFPETEMDNRRHYKYGTPWPLSEDFYLSNMWEDLVLLDRFGNKELLGELALLPCPQDERLRIIDPIPVRPRPAPPRLPARTRRSESAAAAAPRPPATIAVMNVYDSDLPFPEGTRIRWLRVTQNILKENHLMGVPMIGYERENTPRIPLGIVPVEEDGSAYFEAPVAKELIFQVLDADFAAVQSMRSIAFVHPGEQLTCQGCHEKAQATPAPARPPVALRRPPSRLAPELGRIEPISYCRQIRPIFENTCLPCHRREGKGIQEMSYGALREDAFWFAGAMWTDMTGAYSGIHGGSRTIPGRFGARYCRLGRALLDDAHRQAVSAEERHAVILWLDSNSPRLGAYRDEAAQLRGELVWPVLDVDLDNLFGVETSGAPLRSSFWHENGYGPHACLVSEHAHDRVVILDDRGAVVWEYGVPHPQDVWMLDSGNILVASTRAVREVARDKRVVWEFTTEPPNEIPNCQPLPDGNVLIGIVGECRLVEVDRRGAIVRELKIATTEREPHAQFRMCRKTPEGTYLVPFTAEGAVREYDSAGRVLREFPRRPAPVAALRLPDGNTLISAGGAVTEYDTADNVLWCVDGEWLPDIEFGVPAGLARLPNGNTIVCNWNARDAGAKRGAHIFEVTPDKRIVWEVTGAELGQVAQCQPLTRDLRPRRDGVVR